jgi:serine/threonine protein phosphatase PrpC
MAQQLTVSVGQCSSQGRKAVNQDFYVSKVPSQSLLNSKGIVMALADGISSSQVSQIASQAAVNGFLEDYFSTSEAWSVKTSAQRVLLALNSWLYAQTQQSPYRFNKDRGYICTFSALIMKSSTAHLFHVGDARIYRFLDKRLEQLTEDHRVWVSKEESYLSRALGFKHQLEIDYQALALDVGAVFILATDGVYEFVPDEVMIGLLKTYEQDLQQAADHILDTAYRNGSPDNLTIQIVRIEQLPDLSVAEVQQQLTALPFPPELKPGMVMDGYQIIRAIHLNSRSHIFLAQDSESQQQVVIKCPSVDLRDDPAYLERLLMEEWIARRIDHPHVLKLVTLNRKRHFLYTVTEYIEGQTLRQWMRDHPQPDLEAVRRLVEQIAQGLQAFHRQEMLHQDLRPDNIMLDRHGRVKLIDFGSVRVAGIQEIASPLNRDLILGTAPYTAPEYFIGESPTWRSDLFSLAVITYQMLSGRLPYGTEVAKTRSRSAQLKLTYQSVLNEERDVPVWMDAVLKKACHPNPYRRHEALSEFIYELRHASQSAASLASIPWMERSPVLFWKRMAWGLALSNIALLMLLLKST